MVWLSLQEWVVNVYLYLYHQSIIPLISVGANLEQLINRPDERYCFRYMDQRVYYVRYVLTQDLDLVDHASVLLHATTSHTSFSHHVSFCPTLLCSEKLMKTATNFGRDNLLSIGTCVGKFTKTERFHISITFLDYLAQYAKVNMIFSVLYPQRIMI